jgi:neutral ceramidase
MPHAYLDAVRAASVLFAGAATADITPQQSLHLAGYPHVRRTSTGVHDPLLSSALYLEAGGERIMFIANDIIYVSKDMVARARRRIAHATGVPEGHILISATHTHSGPKTLDPLATSADTIVPKADPEYVTFFEDRIVAAATRAAHDPVPAEIGLAVADATGIGTNRRDPAGAKDLAVPVMVIRTVEHQPLALMLVCSMHPTVLHEDSTFISGDFPGLARLRLQQQFGQIPVLYHTGPAGNQSPRHVTKANTFAEAQRLGAILADAAIKAVSSIAYTRQVDLECRRSFVTLPVRSFPSEAQASETLKRATARLRELRKTAAPKTKVRTAEVDLFGAEETVTLARQAASGTLVAAAQSCMPAEIQAILIGPWTFIAWPGEMFVEFALDVKGRINNAFPISYANGELQGYLVTQQAADEGGYESANAIFKSPESGEMLVKATLDLLKDKCAS